MSGAPFRLDDDHTTRAFLATVAFMFAAIVAIAPAALVDQRTLWEVSVWSKPLKFSFALMIHFATLSFLAQLLAPRRRAGALMTVFVWLAVTAALFEIVYIILQAARGRHSHFNYETTLESALYGAMGVGALLLVFAPFVMGLLLATQKGGDRSGLRLGAVLGLLLAPIATITIAGTMSMSGSHWIGAATSDATGVPLFGWSREVGDYRPGHFAALHMMQTLPLVGLAADKIAPGLARLAVFVVAAGQAALAAALFVQARAGQPLWPL